MGVGVTALVTFLGYIAIPANTITAFETLSGIPFEWFMVGLNLIIDGAIIAWIFKVYGDEIRDEFPIIAGGMKLRRLKSLVSELLAAKELNLSDPNAATLTQLSIAIELGQKLDKLCIPHPNLLMTHRSDLSKEEITEYFYVLAFLTGLRNLCVSGDLKRAQSIHKTPNA